MSLRLAITDSFSSRLCIIKAGCFSQIKYNHLGVDRKTVDEVACGWKDIPLDWRCSLPPQYEIGFTKKTKEGWRHCRSERPEHRPKSNRRLPLFVFVLAAFLLTEVTSQVRGLDVFFFVTHQPILSVSHRLCCFIAVQSKDPRPYNETVTDISRR